MLVSAVSVLVVAQSSSEIPEGLMNNPVYILYKVYREVLRQRQAQMGDSVIICEFRMDFYCSV